MEQSRKNLKIMSIAMLVLAILSLARVALELSFGINADAIEGATKELMFAAVIVLAVISVILTLPQIYIGLKGLRVAKNPDDSKGHIVWSTILLVISIIAVVCYVIGSISSGDYKEKFSAILDMVLDVVIYSTFLKYAKEVRANA